MALCYCTILKKYDLGMWHYECMPIVRRMECGQVVSPSPNGAARSMKQYPASLILKNDLFR